MCRQDYSPMAGMNLFRGNFNRFLTFPHILWAQALMTFILDYIFKDIFIVNSLEDTMSPFRAVGMFVYSEDRLYQDSCCGATSAVPGHRFNPQHTQCVKIAVLNLIRLSHT